MTSEVSTRLVIILFLAVMILIVLGSWLLLESRPEPTVITIYPPDPTATPAPTATPTPTATPAPVLVYVTGAVQQAGTVHLLPPGSRVMDAAAAAGGLTDLADPSLVNMAGILRDGDQVHVRAIQPAGGDEALPTPPGGQRVHINTAALDELQTLPGVGPAIAQRIVEYRQENGPFKRFDDLGNVSGIGLATLEEWRELVLLD